jgi:translocation and assembly module TamB
MSEPEDMQPAHPEPAAPPPAPPRRRGRRFLRLGLLAALLLVVGTVILYFWASSESTQNMVRKAMIDRLQQVTGGRVEIASFHWNLLDLSAEAGGVVIHGRESTEEAPLAKVERINARISLFGLWSPRILLRSLEILKPEFHVIVYPDGVTNIPQPRAPRKPGKPVIETLFNLQAGHVSIEQGVLDYENRAAEFDFQNRFTLLDIDARDFSALMRYVPPTGKEPETYHLEAGATDLSVVRGKDKPALGEMQATLDLTRSDAFLRSLRITTKFPATTGRGEEQHTIAVSGSLHDFAHPRWNATATGELDLRLLDPALGYPLNPQGIAHLNLESAGQAGQFRVDGTVHAVNTSYVGTGVVVTGALLDAHVHADPKQLLVSKIAVHLRQGGQIDGEVALTPWLPGKVPGGASIERSGMAGVRATGPVTRPKRPLPPDPNVIEIPVNGKVIANFKDVTLDAILDMVGQPPFQRLGLDTLVNGGTRTDWVKGDQQTINVVAQLALNLPQKPVAGEVPTQGAIDATYTQRDGAVDLRTLVLNTPASRIDAHGHLGAYPLNSPSGFDIDFKSHDLTEFDSVLRDLGLHRYGKTGVAALPVISSGEMDFLHGKWTGSLASPRLAGNFKATQVGLEMLPQKPAPNDPTPVEPKFVHWDSIEGTGSYAPERISVTNGLMKRGNAQIAVDGSLDATPGRVPTFNEDSILHMRVQAGKVGTDDLLPLLGVDLPVHGSLDTQLAIDGPIRSPGGSGWAELTNATAYGEPFSRMRVQGTLANNQVKLASATISAPSGSVSGSGNYDLKSRRFQVSARGNAIDIAKIRTLHDRGADAGGSLSFTVDGDGTLDDPRLDARANFTGLTVGGEDLGALVFSAHTANKAATYKASTRVEGAEIDLTGQTALSGDYPTQAKLNFSHFDIGGLLKTAHVTGLTGESALAGAITVAGPLAHPAEMHGDARLQDLAVTVAGVHLASQGEVHATLAGGRITLDPLHVTGEDTDLHVQGNLSLKDKQQLDLAASGSINMKLAETVDSDLTASGTTTFQVEAHGTVSNPDLRGRIDFQNASLSLEDVPNGLSQLHGTLEFNQNRLEVKSLTAMSGGGLLTVGGYLSYQHGIYADLSVTGNQVRIRYPAGVSSLADTTLHLQGSQNNLLLSGNVLITRFSVSPDLDFAALATQAGSVATIAPPDAPSNHIRYDVRIQSSPQLNFQNSFAKLAGNVDLRLRGTVASPSLLGRVAITEGSALIAGTRYDLQRGDVTFTNPVRIEPTIDLNATARVEDYDITLGLHGTPQKLGVTYRSDPPLPESDVLALLALGRTENQQRLYTQQQEQSVANPTTDALLGGALNATVSSRVQRLFGASSVKVDPNYIGTLGNSTSRITVEEQLGRNITLTFATDVDTTGQQLLQAEIAINRHVSLLVARDESGVFSMVVKATRRYR